MGFDRNHPRHPDFVGGSTSRALRVVTVRDPGVQELETPEAISFDLNNSMGRSLSTGFHSRAHTRQQSDQLNIGTQVIMWGLGIGIIGGWIYLHLIKGVI